MKLSYRLVNLFLVFASVVGMAFALYLEHFKGLQPCPLCVFQRVGLIFMGLFALIALLHNPKLRIFRVIYAFLATLSILWSFAVAARHVWIQHLPASEVPSCGPGLNYLVDVLPMKEVLSQVLTGSGECAKIDWTFLGQSMPVWSLLFFAVLLFFSFTQFLRKA
ncbi:disulfide bond formation protein B [Acinetobacter boissieri]|uniref:Disulfide bond formation protein B n=1 Tax=Acinetobacter boissieri TaxID=1219383 RepID=A0A1G6GJW0_9GAMM|nr:disulfide bond formation protein B [Acinetobacter boissieri]SDB82230.1 Thiol:disulfide interchange protein DsbB [Acinetobacter boissieri]